MEESIVVDSIESRGQNETGQDGHITTIKSTQLNGISRFEFSRLRAVTWTVSRPRRTEQTMGVQVGNKKLPQNYYLNGFGTRMKRLRLDNIVLKAVVVKSRLFEKWLNDSMFKS